jgi:hypothetical protein
MNRSSIAWNSAGNFNNRFKRIQTSFRRFSLAPSYLFLLYKIRIKLKGEDLIQLRTFKRKGRRY